MPRRPLKLFALCAKAPGGAHLLRASGSCVYCDRRPRKNAAPIILHVNRQLIAKNAKHLTCRPTIIIRQGRRRVMARHVELAGPSQLRGDAGQLSCGARVWLETRHPVWYR